MNSQLKWKFAFILAVLLVCIYGVVGLPTFPTSLDAGKTKPCRSHPARPGPERRQPPRSRRCSSRRPSASAATRPSTRSASSSTTRISASAKSAAWTTPTFSSAASTQPLPAAFATSSTINLRIGRWPRPRRETNGYLLTMKPCVISDIRKDAMDQSLEVITRRINALGLTEPTIAFTGRSDDEILVQLPGEGDPTPDEIRDSSGRAIAVDSRGRRPIVSIRGRGARGERWRPPARHDHRSRQIRSPHARASHPSRFTTFLPALRLSPGRIFVGASAAAEHEQPRPV